MMLKIFRILGESLHPEFRHNDFVLVASLGLSPRLRPGDAVVFQRVGYGLIIKKVDRLLPGSGSVIVSGNNPFSIDSRIFGPIRAQDIVGKVVFHIRGSGVNAEG